MSYLIDVQLATDDPLPFSEEQLTQWASLPLQAQLPRAELTLRVVDAEEMIQLNHHYRQQNKTTNVLAFPAQIPESIELDYPLLGDVIICPVVLAKESQEQNKSLEEHWAHIIIHGVLHLLGYDHIEDDDALTMQAIESQLLMKSGYNDPYRSEGE